MRFSLFKGVNDFKRNSLSRKTITRRVEELSRNIESALQEKLRTCVFYSSALNESTDQTSSYSSYELFVLRIMQELNPRVASYDMLGEQLHNCNPLKYG